MCTPSIIGGSVAAIANKKNKKEAANRQRDIGTATKQKAAVRSSKISSRRKQAISSFTSNVASGGQLRAANKGS
jgi:hypothetical protein